MLILIPKQCGVKSPVFNEVKILVIALMDVTESNFLTQTSKRFLNTIRVHDPKRPLPIQMSAVVGFFKVTNI